LSREGLRILKAVFWAVFALDGLFSALFTYRWIRALLKLPGPEVYHLVVALFLIPPERVLRIGGTVQFLVGLINLARALGLTRFPRPSARRPSGRTEASGG
jgi:hypothetical protein